MSHALQFSNEFLVWVDETGSNNKNQIRKFGYALGGETLVYYHCF